MIVTILLFLFFGWLLMGARFFLYLCAVAFLTFVIKSVTSDHNTP